eukprot:6625111-Pyramimonas_sp.AAC.1
MVLPTSLSRRARTDGEHAIRSRMVEKPQHPRAMALHLIAVVPCDSSRARSSRPYSVLHYGSNGIGGWPQTQPSFGKTPSPKCHVPCPPPGERRKH